MKSNFAAFGLCIWHIIAGSDIGGQDFPGWSIILMAGRNAFSRGGALGRFTCRLNINSNGESVTYVLTDGGYRCPDYACAGGWQMADAKN